MLNMYLAEYLGSLFIMYIILVTGSPIAIGAAFAIAIALTLKISGGMFNPMIDIVMAVGGKIPYSEVLPRILVQIAGGLTALELTKLVKI
jgi:glycerol uptake facilitator-like aquaporin